VIIQGKYNLWRQSCNHNVKLKNRYHENQYKDGL
jgi:hypothetical protein